MLLAPCPPSQSPIDHMADDQVHRQTAMSSISDSPCAHLQSARDSGLSDSPLNLSQCCSNEHKSHSIGTSLHIGIRATTIPPDVAVYVTRKGVRVLSGSSSLSFEPHFSAKTQVRRRLVHNHSLPFYAEQRLAVPRLVGEART